MDAKRAAKRRRLIDMLESAIAAEEQAAVLRKIHGFGAERVCDALIAGHCNSVVEIEHLKDVRRALRWV
jgi:hypothetical protein